MITAKEVLEATTLLAPVVEDVALWIAGKSDHEPPVLAQLPADLRSEAALKRARARAANAGSNPPPIPNRGE